MVHLCRILPPDPRRGSISGVQAVAAGGAAAALVCGPCYHDAQVSKARQMEQRLLRKRRGF